MFSMLELVFFCRLNGALCRQCKGKKNDEEMALYLSRKPLADRKSPLHLSADHILGLANTPCYDQRQMIKKRNGQSQVI